MRVLGIDTATWTASVGVADGEAVLAEVSRRAAPSHGLSLLPLIEEVLAVAGLRGADLQAIAVSIGPGSFTGLRIGLSSAKGLAFALGLEVTGVPTLEALAHVPRLEKGLVCPMLDARKGEVYTALYEASGGALHCRLPECAVEIGRWLRRLPGPCVFVGDAVEILERQAAGSWEGTALPFAEFHPRGGVVASLGARRLGCGEAGELAALEPRYLRPSEAELAEGGPRVTEEIKSSV